MTLLLRQVMAAFWFTILIPLVTFLAIEALGGEEWIVVVVLGSYAVAGFFLARRRFLTLEDTAWTGGVVTLGGRRVAEGSATREPRQWAALFWKELQLHEFTLAGIAVLFVLHLGVVVVRKLGANTFGHAALSALEMFGVVWLFVPLLAGSQSVADERQLGTLDGLLCLPVSRRVQFTVKLIFVLVLGGVLSAALLCGVEVFGNHINAGAHLGVMGFTFMGGSIVRIFYIFLTVSLIGFYASTLTKSVVQALAAGVVATLLFWAYLAICKAASNSEYFSGWKLWSAIEYPTLILTVLWLAYGNFRFLFESGRRWRRNILALIAVNVLICCSAAAVYERVWEYAMPLEQTHGSAKLPQRKAIVLHSYFGGDALAIVLPDGRVWVDHGVSGGILSSGKSFFPPGSNWQDAAPLEREIVALRSDGTLWLSDSNGLPFLQFGTETNWQSLAARSMASAVLLKRDGSMWFWGTNNVNWRFFPGLRAMAPKRLGSDSDWARILRGSEGVFAWKRNGSAFLLHWPGPDEDWGDVRLPGLDHVQFKELSSYPASQNTEKGLRDDGTLWHWNRWKESWANRPGARWPKLTDMAPPVLAQFGQGPSWIGVSGEFVQVLALKTDGTLWKWNLFDVHHLNQGSLNKPPQQLGENHDWVGVGMWQNQSVALAADGDLWSWPRPRLPFGWETDSDSWLLPSRRPTKIANIFEATDPRRQ